MSVGTDPGGQRGRGGGSGRGVAACRRRRLGVWSPPPSRGMVTAMAVVIDGHWLAPRVGAAVPPSPVPPLRLAQCEGRATARHPPPSGADPRAVEPPLERRSAATTCFLSPLLPPLAWGHAMGACSSPPPPYPTRSRLPVLFLSTAARQLLVAPLALSCCLPPPPPRPALAPAARKSDRGGGSVEWALRDDRGAHPRHYDAGAAPTATPNRRRRRRSRSGWGAAAAVGLATGEASLWTASAAVGGDGRDGGCGFGGRRASGAGGRVGSRWSWRW